METYLRNPDIQDGNQVSKIWEEIKLKLSHSLTNTYTQRHTHIHTCLHKNKHTYLKTRYRAFSFAIYITDMQQTYITGITKNSKYYVDFYENIYLIQGIVQI